VSTGTIEVHATIVVAGGTFDGGCKTYIPGRMNADSHSETDAARALLFHVQNGAKLRNVIIGQGRIGTGRAFEISNGATLENVRILTAHGDTYFRIRSAGAVTLTGITALGKLSMDRHISGNGAGLTVKLSNCIFTSAPRVFRQIGGTTYQTSVAIDRCDFSNISNAVARTDGPTSTAAVTNSRLHNVRQVCLGYAPGNCRESGNVVY
jgi:pectate lyase C